MDSQSRPHVLIVDDNTSNLTAVSAVMSALPVEVIAVSSGAQAVSVAEQREFAVILLDVMMPGLDGMQTLQLLRAQPAAKTTPVIFMTALAGELDTIKRAYALGAVDYISKPVDADILVAKVHVFVTLWRQAQENARLAQRLLAKDRHMGILAHDLRTPLSTVLMAAARLEESADPSVREQAARISRASTKMASLTNDVLQFARAAAAHFPLEPVDFDLSALCDELLGDFAATHPGVAFSRDLPLEVKGRWDCPRMHQAISNLLNNAVKYGTGWVRLQIIDAASEVSIIVENGGTPIPPSQLERLFEPFERAHRGASGVGLGLFIVQEIARAHGGQVSVISDERVTTFRLRLPSGRTVETSRPAVSESSALETGCGASAP